MMKLDDSSIAIIRQLSDGRKSFKKIANELGISENTVRARVSKLKAEGVMSISARVNPENIPDYQMLVVAVKLKTTNGIRKAKELVKLRNVISVSAVTGRYDLIMTVVVTKDFGLTEFITEEMDRVGDIQAIETFVVYKSFQLEVPYT
jgi:Lrp/AsnC family transcriptional regulator, regulator for asnA, asnC and gidA